MDGSFLRECRHGQSTSRRPSPPYNPGLKDLVDGKRAWDARDTMPDRRRGFSGWHERGYLPHRDSPGLTQFITYHLDDAFPRTLREQWAALLKIEDDHEKRKQLETYLDKSQGTCWLRQREIADICEKALLFFDQTRYRLKGWCLMPNHIHVLVDVTSVPMSAFVKSWKGYTGRECAKLLNLSSDGFWAPGYYDTYMRDVEYVRRCISYIERNPVKAGMVQSTTQWAWSSARFRDASGGLVLP